MPTAEKTVQEVCYWLQWPNCCWRHDSERSQWAFNKLLAHSKDMITSAHFLTKSLCYFKDKKKYIFFKNHHSAWTQNSTLCVHLRSGACGGALHSKRLASAADMSVSISECSTHCAFSYSRRIHLERMKRWILWTCRWNAKMAAEVKFPFSIFRCIKKSTNFVLTFYIPLLFLWT